MALFSKPKVIIWPQANSVEVFIDKDSNNHVSFDISLSKPQTQADLEPIIFFCKKNNIKDIHLLLSDDLVLTKSFVHDSTISQIDQNELSLLAKSSVDFEIDPNFIVSSLVPRQGKTIIKSHILKPKKFTNLVVNLKSLGLNIISLTSVSQALAHLFTNFYDQDYFLLFPLSKTRRLFFLAQKGSVYLSEVLKGDKLEVQKIINYSKLYFDTLTTKFFSPSDSKLNLVTSSQLDTTTYDASQINLKFNKLSNLPLPILSLFTSTSKPDPNNLLSPAIMNQVNMSDQTNNSTSVSPPTVNVSPAQKKNTLPVIAVFVITASIVSIVIWFVLNQNDQVTSPETENQPEVSENIAPTSTIAPTPTLAEISQDIQLQVLNATDINGQAASFKATLVKLGFTDVSVGNSTERLTQNEIRIKSDGSDIATYFTQKLADSFPFVVKTTLDQDSKFDAVFIVAKDLRDTPVPSEPESDSTSSAVVEE